MMVWLGGDENITTEMTDHDHRQGRFWGGEDKGNMIPSVMKTWCLFSGKHA